jgi:phosphoenolpyruvate carboxykinase (ATP)
MEYYTDPVFGFQVPKHCPGIPDSVLYPSSAWPSEDSYMKRYTSLAARFIDNFKKFTEDCPPEVVNAGPKI